MQKQCYNAHMRRKLPGVYLAQRKDNSMYYRASCTCRNKHISLGSFCDEESAFLCYSEALRLWKNPAVQIADYRSDSLLTFDKWVVIINFRDNGIYFPTPIYLRTKFFFYYLNPEICLKFDIDDLFYYSSRKIMKRGNHLFVADYGMQVNIANRYGIKNNAVLDRDYVFLNRDIYDYRYSNIHIINKYTGVTQTKKGGKTLYRVKIHIHGDYVVGTYTTETEAAIAYNKAADILKKKGITKNYIQNYTEEVSPRTYAELYNKIEINDRIIHYSPNHLIE